MWGTPTVRDLWAIRGPRIRPSRALPSERINSFGRARADEPRPLLVAPGGTARRSPPRHSDVGHILINAVSSVRS